MTQLSLTSRLSLLFMLSVVAVLMVAGLSFNQLSRQHFMQLDRQTLEEKRHATQDILAGCSNEEQFAGLKPRLRALLGAHHNMTAMIFDAAGSRLFAEPGPFELPDQLRDNADGAIWELQVDELNYLGLTTKAGQGDTPGQKPLTVILILDATSHMHFFSLITQWFWIGLVISALVSALLGWMVARSGLNPLRAVTSVAASISANSLKERIALTSVPLELQQLVITFNAMLSRLDDAFVRLSNFSADIAHELRTPLSNLMTETEVVLSKKRDASDYQESLYDNLEDLRRMSRMIDDMLFLAKADNGLIIPQQACVALNEVVTKLFEYYQLLADERGIRLAKTGHGSVYGDAMMLERALANLLSNALRYTPSGETIQVSLRQSENRITLSIENPGEKISAEHMNKLFDRFYRVDPARRQGNTSNAGLGLAITRSIVEAHKGRIWCTSTDGLTGFHMEFPRQPT